MKNQELPGNNIKTKTKHKPEVYFKNLDGVRFIAASLVLLQHSFSFKAFYFGDKAAKSIFDLFFSETGRMGVNIFFILSGFLISFLLLTEKQSTGIVNYKNFYIRRILRIWPLYIGYGLVLTLIAPFVENILGMNGGTHLSEVLINLCFLFFFSVNYQLAFAQYNKNIFEISWSVCIEEQFYLIWPFLLDKCMKNLKTLIACMFATSVVVRIIVCVIIPHFGRLAFLRASDINYLMLFDKLDLFTAGLILALLFRNKEKHEALFKKIFHPAVQVIMIVLSLLYILSIIKLSGIPLIFFDHYICDILFGYVLLSAVLKNSILNFEHALLKTLGKISYGLYIYHIAVCQLVMLFFRKFLNYPGSHFIYDILYPLTNMIFTCLAAYISYRYYESFFLKRKKKFEVIPAKA